MRGRSSFRSRCWCGGAGVMRLCLEGANFRFQALHPLQQCFYRFGINCLVGLLPRGRLVRLNSDIVPLSFVPSRTKSIVFASKACAGAQKFRA